MKILTPRKLLDTRLPIEIYDAILFNFVIAKNLDLDKSSLLSFSANFCRYNCPKIDTIPIIMNVETPNGDIISSGINSGLVHIATSIIKQRFINKMKEDNFLISEKKI